MEISTATRYSVLDQIISKFESILNLLNVFERALIFYVMFIQITDDTFHCKFDVRVFKGETRAESCGIDRVRRIAKL